MLLLNIFLTVIIFSVLSTLSGCNLIGSTKISNNFFTTADSVAPLITATNITIGLHDQWNDDVSAADNIDGDLTTDVLITGNVVNTNTEGDYTLTYDVTDSAGNNATQVSRIVTVTYCSAAKIADTPYANSNETPLGDGSGTPYTICSLTQLAAIATNIETDKAFDFDLRIDINASNTSEWDSKMGWTPIGIDLTNFYSGTFNGNNHVISNLFINRNEDYQGLFGYIESATIHDLGLESVNITGADNVGGLVGYAADSTLNNVYTTGTISGNNSVGGLAGFTRFIITDGTISNAYSSGRVSATNQNVGGLIGLNANIKITNSYASGAITTPNNLAGGLVGKNEGDETTINNCYATGDVDAGNYAGGLIGSHIGEISNSFATGTVSADNVAGGLVGSSSYPSIIEKSYATGVVTATSHAGGLLGSIVGADFVPAYSNLSDSFATGNVNSCTSLCGGLIGYTYYTIFTNNYRYFDHDLDNDDDPDGKDGGHNINIDDYYDPTAAPLSNWDFPSWIDNGTTYPTLR